MNSTERVKRMIMGEKYDRQPIYGWVNANLSKEISEVFGSVENFEDKYEFDMAHIFGGPDAFNRELLEKIKSENEEFTPDLLISEDIFTDPDNIEAYEGMKKAIEFHKKRDRFCYVQTPGFFEQFNSVFPIEEHLLWLALYPEELSVLYKKQAEWTKRFALHAIEAGADMIHISDDWGSQKDLLFSPKLWQELIYPNMKEVVDFVHSQNVFCSLHSDGCILKIADKLPLIGFDLVHPWQENAGMSLDLYNEKYSDKFAILGGICVQSAIGILHKDELEKEIRRVFDKLKGKRWCVCTSHFVQNHCSIEDLTFAYDLIYKLARE